jgi:hypothetical protein
MKNIHGKPNYIHDAKMSTNLLLLSVAFHSLHSSIQSMHVRGLPLQLD